MKKARYSFGKASIVFLVFMSLFFDYSFRVHEDNNHSMRKAYAAEASSSKTDQYADLLGSLIELADSVEGESFTEESYTVFEEDFSNAVELLRNKNDGNSVSAVSLKNAFENLYHAYYWGLTPASSIKISLTCLDGEKAVYRERTDSVYGSESRYGVNQTVSLKGTYTLQQALAKVGLSLDKHTIFESARIYINDVYITESYFVENETEFLDTDKANSIILHPNDQVVVAWTKGVRSTMLPNIYTQAAYFSQYVESLATSDFLQGDSIEVNAGDAFDLTATTKYGRIGSNVSRTGDHLTLFISDESKSASGNHATPHLLKTVDGNLIETNQNGEASVTLYKEGWYLVTGYDLRSDKLGNVESVNTGEVTKGVYYSLNSGAAIWVHVNTPEDLEAVKSTLKQQLKNIYGKYGQEIFRPEKWSQVKEAYDLGVQQIAAAESSGDAYDAQQQAISTIQYIQNATVTENQKNLEAFRKLLSSLPDDSALLTAHESELVAQTMEQYGNMSDYQKSCLTTAEQEKYLAVAAAYEAGLPENQDYNLTVNIQADNAQAETAITNMLQWLQNHTAREDAVGGKANEGDLQKALLSWNVNGTEYGFQTSAYPNDDISVNVSPDYSAYFLMNRNEDHSLSGDGWKITDEGFTLTPTKYMHYALNGGFTYWINGKAYEIKGITFSGIEASKITSGDYVPLDYSSYKGKDPDWVNMHHLNASRAFSMPYQDVTLNIEWGPVAEASGDDQHTKHVYFSLTNDGEYVTGTDGTVLGLVPVDVSYKDLSEYGLEEFTRVDDFGNVIEQPTALDLFIQMLETYYLGGEKLQVGTDALTITGGYTSMYMHDFWGHDENLTYYVNHAYPLMYEGWGSTADWILLEDGDVIEVAMYSDWGFYSHENAGFQYWANDAGQFADQYQIQAGTDHELTLHKAGVDTEANRCDTLVAGQKVYYASTLSTKASDWTELGSTDENGKIRVHLTKAGVYYLKSATDIGDRETAINSPALAKLTVSDQPVKYDAAYVKGLIENLGEITLDSGNKLQAARQAYDGLDANEKAKVTNYQTLVQGEETYEILQVEHLIEQLPAASQVTKADETAIWAAEAAYNNLDAALRKKVSVRATSKLTGVLEALAKLDEEPEVTEPETDPDPDNVLLGDADGNGKVQSRDGTRILQYLAGKEVSIDLKAADYDQNGKIQSRDVTKLLKMLAGM